ncbi:MULTISPECIES: hypothetical protein [unclassified Breznakia]|uniref:hypothetical protein n=1 Tax=unclassified Breznakia TaxID=2623764 RepID=UPI0024076347|nr:MULTISPECIES: hypothetical protein [unclassified Breznakia]MDF9837045.1 hypothetical protein [Breznakia sp. PFB2-8]MDF9858970.1 hypothetical protein [Breznakia sp. PH5-24]
MKKIGIIFALTILSISSYVSNVDASANVISIKAKLYRMVEDELEEIPKGFDYTRLDNNEKVKIVYEITNNDNPIWIDISLPSMEGLSVDKETESIVQKVKSKSIFLEDTYTLSVDAYIDADAEKIVSKLDIKIISGDNKGSVHGYSFEHKSKALDISETNEFVVNFYGVNNRLISKQRIDANEKAQMPIYTPLGYEVLGFNSQSDGSGRYYQSENITRNHNFYAIYKAKKFKVHYYVESKLYTTKEVTYNADALYVEPPEIKGKTFVAWYGKMSNIREDVHLYAIYEDKQGQYISIDGEAELNETVNEFIETYNIYSKKIGGYEGIDIYENRVKDGDEEYYAWINEKGDLKYIDKGLLDEYVSKADNSFWKLIFIVSIGMMGILFILAKKHKKEGVK